MPVKTTSYPKDKIKILLLEHVSDAAVTELQEAGYTHIKRIAGALSERELIKEIKGVHILGIRSKTQISESILKKADKLLAIGCYCIGTNQVDLQVATRLGVAVFNAPYSNTRSVAELVIGLSIMLLRKVTDKSIAAHAGKWLKDAKGCYEMRGKTMGLIGYGNIGAQVSVLAEAMGMRVIYYDIEPKLPHGNAKAVRSIAALMRGADVVSLHVPADVTTAQLINARTLSHLRKGSYLINASRGEVLDIDALRDALLSGVLAGAAVDVYPVEPERSTDRFTTVLQQLPNVILTPHIGGSTEEAQLNIGLDVTAKLLHYLERGATTGSHTVPAIMLHRMANTHRILHIHDNIPGVMAEINATLSAHGINILGQYLHTNTYIGYTVIDLDKSISASAAALLQQVKGTIRMRLLY
jgi:D-3-phosphoglycerate dehydrogenase / 2-oxoglutarate reductase